VFSIIFWDVTLYDLVDGHHSASFTLRPWRWRHKFLENISKFLPDYTGFEILTGVVMEVLSSGIDAA
jgi:hypothetical protein